MGVQDLSIEDNGCPKLLQDFHGCPKFPAKASRKASLWERQFANDQGRPTRFQFLATGSGEIGVVPIYSA
jgi:hypothetical protein